MKFDGQMPAHTGYHRVDVPPLQMSGTDLGLVIGSMSLAGLQAVLMASEFKGKGRYYRLYAITDISTLFTRDARLCHARYRRREGVHFAVLYVVTPGQEYEYIGEPESYLVLLAAEKVVMKAFADARRIQRDT